MSLTLTLGVIAFQLATGYANMKHSSKLQKEIAAHQQELEKKTTLNGISNARKEMDKLFSLQRDLEKQMQNDRLNNLKANLCSSLDLIAYSESLENWPMLVPPFVMKNEALPFLTDNPDTDVLPKISMQVILTNCLDRQFNVKIFPDLEERINEYLCKYWNIGSKHSITFYKGGWKDSTKDASQFIDNLKDRLKSVPTLVLSPVITKDEGLFFSVSCWGIANSQEIRDNSTFIPKGLKFNYQPNYDYSKDDKEQVIKELLPIITALISYFTDLYYWLYYNVTPLLPTLIDTELKDLNLEQKNDYLSQYKELFKKSMSDPSIVNLHPDSMVEIVKTLFPEYQREEIVFEICNKIRVTQGCHRISSIAELLELDFSIADIAFLNSIKEIFPSYSNQISTIVGNLQNNRNSISMLSNNEK